MSESDVQTINLQQQAAAQPQQLTEQQIRVKSINMLISAVRKAQQAGAYSLQESHQIYEAISNLASGSQEQQ
jgi:cell division protein YceG involved in septum cleavage